MHTKSILGPFPANRGTDAIEMAPHAAEDPLAIAEWTVTASQQLR